MMFKLTLSFFPILGFNFFRTSCRDVLPSLLKNCCTDCELCPLFTNYSVYLSDLNVKSLSQPQMQCNLRETSFWIPLIDNFS